jgi:tetratricopeptide (TPR) repeat protein
VDRPTERIYGLREVVRILGLTPKRTAQLKRLDLLLNDAGYTFRDLLAVRAASALLDAGASVRQIRQAITALKQRDQTLVSPLSELRLLVDGRDLVAQSDRVRFDPRTGQTMLDLGAGDLQRDADATLTTGLVRPMSPPAEQAETWFDRASEWEADPAQWEDAVDAYRRVVAIDPTYAAAWNNLGLLLHRLGQYDEARRAYATALSEDGSLCEAAYNLGSLWEDLSDIGQAIHHYRLALELAPDYADAHFNLAAVLARAGRPDEAGHHWQRYLDLDSSSPWARIARAHLELVEPPRPRTTAPRPDGRSGE